MNLSEKFEGWLNLYLLDQLTYNFCGMHKEWFGLFEKLRVAIAAPRNFGKSYIFSFFYPLFCALEGPYKDILLISATGALAEKWLDKISNELVLNREILADFGDQKGFPWRQDEIHLNNGVVIRAKGVGYQIRGFRPDLIIADDIENDESVLSEDQRHKLDEWFWKALVGTLNPQSQLVIVGTLLHPLSFLSNLVKGREGWTTQIFKALDDDGRSVWPSRWPTAELLKRKSEIGAPAFSQEFMNNPIPDEWRTFKPEYIKYWDDLPKNLNYFTTVDPARTSKDTSDNTAIVTCGVDSSKNIYVVEYTRAKLTPSEIVNEIFRHYEFYKPKCVGVEFVCLNEWLKFHLDEECEKRKVYPYFKELKIDLTSKGQKKRYRIECMQPYFEKGKIRLKNGMTELVDELLCFPTGRKDDVIDALSSILEIMAPASEEKPTLPEGCFQEWWLNRKRKSRREHMYQ